MEFTIRGKKIAKTCVGEIQLEGNGRPQGCTAFSAKPKTLQWSNSKKPIDILPQQTSTLNVAFYDSKAPDIPFGGSCAHQKEPRIKAWASTLGVESANSNLQDGFCLGEFRIRITIYSANADPVYRQYILKVPEVWKYLEMH